MSDLIEAMANAYLKANGDADLRAGISAAFAKLRETHHLVPKDQELVTSVVFMGVELPLPVPLYALEKRHD